MNPTHPSFPSLPSPCWSPQVEPMGEKTPKADRGTSAIWSKLLPKGPTEEQSKNPVAVLSWENKLKQFYADKNMVATNQFFQLGIEVSISWWCRIGGGCWQRRDSLWRQPLSSTSDLMSTSRRSGVQRAEEESLITVACPDAHKYGYKWQVREGSQTLSTSPLHYLACPWSNM